jgi:hypothetical protein
MLLLILFAAAFYLSIAFVLFRHWLQAFHQDAALSNSNNLWSVMLIAIASMLWFFTLPCAYLELQKVAKVQNDQIQSAPRLSDRFHEFRSS